MTYRDEAESWLARRDAMPIDEREAADHARRLEARRRLPVVASARIASPCHETFEAMSGTGAIRTCARCDEQVFDLARMTLDQVEALVASRSGKLCARLHQRSDGTMMFADCTVGAAGVRARRAGALVATVAAAGVSVAIASALPRSHTPHVPYPAHREGPAQFTQVMGLMMSPTAAPLPAFTPSTTTRIDPNDPLARFTYDGVDPVTGQRGYGALLTP